MSEVSEQILPLETVKVEAVESSAQSMESVPVSEEQVDHSVPMNTDQNESVQDSQQDHHPEQDAETLIQEKEEVDPMLIKEQFKWANALVRNMKKKKDAILFLNPVDPVALNIPTYFTVITHPMDISTIEKKMAVHDYKSVDELFADVDLMFSNCYTFNGVDSAVSLMAKNLQDWYLKELPKLPRSLKQLESKKRKKSLSYGLEPTRTAEVPRRKSVGRVKSNPEMKFCNYVHREMTKKQNASFAWPFMTPVDPEAMGIPHYRDIIKHPMDLSTIRKKLDLAEYNETAEFEADVRLMLNNCFTFNPAGTDVYLNGKQLEALFEMKWNEKANFLAQYGEKLGDSSDDNDDDDDDQQHIQMLKTQLQLLNQQLQTLMERRNRRKKRRTTQPMSMAHPSSPQPPKPKKKKLMKKKEPEEMIPEEITYEQKRELSDNINILPPDKLPQVFEIIKENAQLNAEEEEEIELDIDSLDKAVLWKLYCFVKKHTRSAMKEEVGYPHTFAGHGGAESSSEEEDNDEDWSSEDEAGHVQKKRKVQASGTIGTVANAPPVPEKTEKKKPKAQWDIPFRTEKGDTTYSGSFAEKTANASLSKQSVTVGDKEKLEKKRLERERQERERKEKKKSYDLLDSAWDMLSKTPKVEQVIDTYPSSPEYDAIPQLDLQTPSLVMEEFVNEFNDYEETVVDVKNQMLEKVLGTLNGEENGLETNDWMLNDQVHQEEEEGAV